MVIYFGKKWRISTVNEKFRWLKVTKVGPTKKNPDGISPILNNVLYINKNYITLVHQTHNYIIFAK